MSSRVYSSSSVQGRAMRIEPCTHGEPKCSERTPCASLTRIVVTRARLHARQLDPHRARGGAIDVQLERRHFAHGHLRGLLAGEDARDVIAGELHRSLRIGAIAHEA